MIKKWLIDGFLPMWAKETVLAENRRLKHQVEVLKQDNQEIRAYIDGMEAGIRAGKKITINTGGNG